jgi:S1-C subfamily serine protease
MSTTPLLARGAAATAALAAAALVLAGPAAADETTPAAPAGGGTSSDTSSETTSIQVAALVQPSVVYEAVTWSGYVYDRYNRQYLAEKTFTVTMQCTGFVVNPDGYVATAGHCVDPVGGKDAIRRQAAQWALENYYGSGGVLSVDDVIGDYRVDVLGTDGQVDHDRVERTVSVSWGAAVSGVQVEKKKPARVLAFQKYEEGDGALLKVDETDLNAIELADTSGVEISSDVVAVGYPAVIDSFTDPDLTPTFDAGSVSSIKTVSHGLLSVFQLSAELSGGMSGGPAVDSEGRVIGVNSSHFVGEPFNYAVPAERITELMSGAGVENTVSETTRTYRDGIRAYFEGDREEAVSDLEQVLDQQPANGLAASYLAKAEDLPAAPAEDSTSTSWVRWAAVGGGVLVAIGSGLSMLVVLLRRRRKPVPAAAVTTGGRAPTAPVPPASAPAGTAQAAPGPAITTGFGPAPASVPLAQQAAPGGVATIPAAHCTSCGHRRHDGMSFCGACGARNVPLG